MAAAELRILRLFNAYRFYSFVAADLRNKRFSSSIT